VEAAEHWQTEAEEQPEEQEAATGCAAALPLAGGPETRRTRRVTSQVCRRPGTSEVHPQTGVG